MINHNLYRNIKYKTFNLNINEYYSVKSYLFYYFHIQCYLGQQIVIYFGGPHHKKQTGIMSFNYVY